MTSSTAVFVALLSVTLGAFAPAANEQAPSPVEFVQQMEAGCSAPQSAKFMVTIGEDGRIATLTPRTGDQPFAASALAVLRSVLEPPSPPPEGERPFVETVTISCSPPAASQVSAGTSEERRKGAGHTWLHVDPVYPRAAREAGVEGVVLVQAVAGADGRMQDVKVLRPGLPSKITVVKDPALEAAAIYAVRQWRSSPTYLKGVPVPTLQTISIKFPPKGPALP